MAIYEGKIPISITDSTKTAYLKIHKLKQHIRNKEIQSAEEIADNNINRKIAITKMLLKKLGIIYGYQNVIKRKRSRKRKKMLLSSLDGIITTNFMVVKQISIASIQVKKMSFGCCAVTII